MAALESVAPFHRLRYEDLCARPEEELASVFGFIGVEPDRSRRARRAAFRQLFCPSTNTLVPCASTTNS